MRNFVLLSEKEWHIKLYNTLKQDFNEFNWTLIRSKKEFNLGNLKSLAPEKVFIPHWSYLIPDDIFNSFDCVVFHMTDLPYGRGGSPLQNLILNKLKTTKISALKVDSGIDTGDIYLKESLSLSGSAQEIFNRSSLIIGKMIKKIILNEITPTKQVGKPTYFKRRNPSDGDLSSLSDLDQVFDYIRMLDADGYPRAFVEFKGFRVEFSGVKKSSNKLLNANVRIIKK